MKRIFNIPPVTASPLAIFHRNDDPEMAREAVKHDIQSHNADYIWKAIVNRQDFEAAEYRLWNGAVRILSKSSRDGIDWQLSYIAPDGIPTMHGDYLLPEHYDSLRGHSMEELYRELSGDSHNHSISVTLLMQDGQSKGDKEVNKKDFSFIADMAKLYSVYNNIPISPDSEFIRAYQQAYGHIEPEDYDRLMTENMLSDENVPKVAVLQSKKGELSFRPWEALEQAGKTGDLSADRYEIVHISEDMAGMTLDEIYAELNRDKPRPSDYYGYSLSAGDVVVLSGEGKEKAYFVDWIDFIELPDNFITHELQAKLMYGLDVRQERDLLERNIAFIDSGNIEFDMTEQVERLSAIDDEYKGIFDLADVRRVMENEKRKIEIIENYETWEEAPDITHRDMMHFLKLDGDYVISEAYMKELRSTGIETMAERLQKDINWYFERAAENRSRYARQHTNDPVDVFISDVSPRLLGEHGEYSHFVQRYMTEGQGSQLIPENVVYVGTGEQTRDLTNYLNVGGAYAEALKKNMELRREFNMGVLEGEEAIPERVREENHLLSDRVFAGMTERDMTQLVYDYEVVFGVPENDRMTKWYTEMSVPVQKPWYKENDLPTDGGEGKIPISRAMIEQKAREICHSEEYISFQQQKDKVFAHYRESKSGIIGGMVEMVQGKAREDIKRQDSPWGAWFATIADPHKPEDYIELDITGYSTTDSVIETATLVLGNNIVERIVMPEVSTQNYISQENTDTMSNRIKQEFVERLSPELGNYKLYNPFGLDKGAELEEHRELLRKEGLSDMPSGEEYAKRMNEENQTHELPHGEEIHQPGNELSTIVPVQEYTGTDGKILAGSRIGMELSTGGQVDRSYVYNAVMDFQTNNDIPPYMKAIDVDGTYEDKDILYDAYDAFVGMSHARDEEMQMYREDMEILAFNFANRTETNTHRIHNDYLQYKFMAEIYYGLKNGLTPEQIDYMIVASAENRFPDDNMRNIRIGFENGLSDEQLKLVEGEDFYTQQYMIEYMVDGGDDERVKALKGADMATASCVIGHYERNNLLPEKAAAIVEAMKQIQESGKNGRFTSPDYDFFADYFCTTLGTEEPETIKRVGKQFAAQLEQNNIRHFVEEKGGVKTFQTEGQALREMDTHGEDGRNAAPGQTSGENEEGKKSAKEILSEQLQEGILNVMNSDSYKQWLDTSSRLFYNNYSINNAFLVFMQKPEATFTMGYEAWKDYGRCVTSNTHGAKIFVPVMAYEKSQGGLYRMITGDLREQLKTAPGKAAAYKVGNSNLEFTMNQSGQMGYRVNGKEKGIFDNQQQVQRFIQNSILGKVPMYFNVGTVFDVQDTVIPEHLWVKRGYSKSELVLDEKGKPIKNRKGEYKIVNTPERQAKFRPHIDMSIAEKDPEKMEKLFEALKAVSERNGIHVYMKEPSADETLNGGADGYFSRQFSEQNPKGFIVISTDLDPTRRCSVMFHEIAHSDLHGNLEKLAQEMKEKNVPRNMRELQAESVAYATARRYGIETDTSSFQYLAMYSKGFELQDLKKSIDVIYKECKKLTQELAAELDARGLNLDLSEKITEPMQKESIDILSKQYIAYALELDNRISSIKQELPNLAAENRTNPERLNVVKEQKYCVDRQEADIVAIKAGIEKLQSAGTREEQALILTEVESAKSRIEKEQMKFSDLTESFLSIAEHAKATLKEEFARSPLETLESMKPDYPQLNDLSKVQLEYVAKSEYVREEYGKKLKTAPQEFVDAVCQRAEQLDKVIGKNGAFVEVSHCEQWTDKAIVQSGALMHPKVADTIIKQGEVQIRGLRMEAEKMGDYFPYSNCKLMVFAKGQEGGLMAYRTQVGIGDGAQLSLSDHLTQLCGKDSDLVMAFDKAVREKGAKEKIIFNDVLNTSGEKWTENESEASKVSTHEEWADNIQQERSRVEDSPQNEPVREHVDKEKDIR